MIKVVMFDLDGTLLPMDQDIFVKVYFGGLGKKLEPFGYDAKKVADAVMHGVGAMIKNDGKETNEVVFWNKFAELLGEDVRKYTDVFEEYYNNEFQKVREVCGFSKHAKEVVSLVKEKGFRVVLATSPMFPKIATESRIKWAGLMPEDFEIYTTYEDYNFAKPSLGYYKDVISRLGVKPEECVMVGNDVLEDMISSELGVKTFLLTDCLINRKNLDYSKYEQGGFEELIEFIKNL